MGIYVTRRRRLTKGEEELITYANHCLNKAINAWRPDRPRWWLSHYGELLRRLDGDIDMGLKKQYARLRRASLQQVEEQRSRLPSGVDVTEHRLLVDN